MQEDILPVCYIFFTFHNTKPQLAQRKDGASPPGKSRGFVGEQPARKVEGLRGRAGPVRDLPAPSAPPVHSFAGGNRDAIHLVMSIDSSASMFGKAARISADGVKKFLSPFLPGGAGESTAIGASSSRLKVALQRAAATAAERFVGFLVSDHATGSLSLSENWPKDLGRASVLTATVALWGGAAESTMELSQRPNGSCGAGTLLPTVVSQLLARDVPGYERVFGNLLQLVGGGGIGALEKDALEGYVQHRLLAVWLYRIGEIGVASLPSGTDISTGVGVLERGVGEIERAVANARRTNKPKKDVREDHEAEAAIDLFFYSDLQPADTAHLFNDFFGERLERLAGWGERGGLSGKDSLGGKVTFNIELIGNARGRGDRTHAAVLTKFAEVAERTGGKAVGLNGGRLYERK